MTGTSYDSAGNGNQAVLNGATATYDAENLQTQTVEPPAVGGATQTYWYDGNGQRVAKIQPSLTVIYVYNAFGQLDAEYTSLPQITSPCTGTCYPMHDSLGSLRAMTDQNGNVVNWHDYLRSARR